MEVIRFSESKQHVLVTGGTGFIGQLLVKALLADGQTVTVLTRDPKKCAWLFNGQVRCIQNMNDLPSSSRVHVIINLAGARILGRRWTAKRRQALLHSRIGTTQRLVEWIAKAECKPRLFLSGSAIGYYGIQARNDGTALAEDSPPQPIFMSELCRKWEAAAMAASDYGVKVACMRFGLVLGRGGALPMMMMPIRLGAGGRLGDGRQVISWIHVHDVVRAIAFLWRAHIGDERRQAADEAAMACAYNFTTSEPVTQEQFSRTAAEVVHRPCFMPTPAWPMRLLLGEQADLLLEGQRVIPARLDAEGFRFTFPTLRLALQSLY